MSLSAEKMKVLAKTCWGLVKQPAALTISLKDIRFLSDRETLVYLKEKGVGIVRFGDGELLHLVGGSIRRQKHDAKLQEKLARILTEYEESASFLIGLPLDLILGNEYEKRGASPGRWRTAKYAALPFLKRNHVYGSSFCFWLWNVVDDNKEEYMRLIQGLLENKDIIYIGDEEHVKDIREVTPLVDSIAVPQKNAFESYEELLGKAIAAAEKVADPLLLVTAGVTATVLSAELNTRGILTYDIGVPFRKKQA